MGSGINVFPVPVHRLELHCGLVCDKETMGVRPALSMLGAQVILGNGLSGSRVCADGPPLPVETSPLPVLTVPDESAQDFPAVLTARAVTRATLVWNKVDSFFPSWSLTWQQSKGLIPHLVVVVVEGGCSGLSLLVRKWLSRGENP